jgi:hypothetical protein
MTRANRGSKSVTTSVTTALVFAVVSCPAPVYALTLGRALAQGLYRPHNAGVVGSSPTPAIRTESAQRLSGSSDSAIARFRILVTDVALRHHERHHASDFSGVRS